jgi:transcriptional regulator with XRE-family HTH domain
MATADDLDPDGSAWHRLAIDLWVWRLERNLSQPDVADILGVDKSSVSNWEAGRIKLPLKHAETLDQVWRTRGHFVWLRRLAESAHDPDWFAQYARYEHQAGVIKAHAALRVPALLQTPEYARALLEGAQVVQDVDQVLEERMARQDILKRPDPPDLQVLIKQSVLEDLYGGPEVMRGQLAHLLDMSRLRNVIIRAVPRSIGAYAGVDGSFTLLSTPGGEYAWAEAVGGGRLISDPAKFDYYRVWWDRIGADALSRDSTRSLTADVMEALQ